jgi:hypothetical protein
MRRKHSAPVHPSRPTRAREDLVGRLEEDIGVNKATASDSGAVKDQYISKQCDGLYAVTKELGEPEKFADVPVRLREILGAIAFAPFQYGHRVTFLGETKRRDAPAETGTDDDEIVIMHYIILAANERE